MPEAFDFPPTNGPVEGEMHVCPKDFQDPTLFQVRRGSDLEEQKSPEAKRGLVPLRS